MAPPSGVAAPSKDKQPGAAIRHYVILNFVNRVHLLVDFQEMNTNRYSKIIKPKVQLVVEPYKLGCYLKKSKQKVVQLQKKQSYINSCVIFQSKHKVCHNWKRQHP